MFDAYAARYRDGFDVPALIPQVYLHFDPVTQQARRASASGSPLARQRMDFLLLFSDRQRVVIEVDGKQHYAKGSTASPELYSRDGRRGPPTTPGRLRGLSVRRLRTHPRDRTHPRW